MVATSLGVGAAVGIEHEVVRNTLIAKGVTPAKAAMFPGIEHEVVRDALAAKAAGAVGTGTAGAAGTAATVAAGKGAGVLGNTGLTNGSTEILTTGSALWSGKSFSLGLGIGLGTWGPVLLAAAGAGAVYAFVRHRKHIETMRASIAESGEVPDQGFMAG